MSKSAKNMLAFWGMLSLVLLIGFCSVKNAKAGGYHSHTTNNYYTTEVTEVTEVIHTTETSTASILTTQDKKISQAIAAMGASGYCQFDYAPGFQGCAAINTFDEQWGIAFQAGKRVDDLLFNGGIACDEEFNECALGGAVNFHF